MSDKKKILVIEDEMEVAELLAKKLASVGYQTDIAYNGLEGLEKLKSFKADLIILDLNMPKMGGVEFYQKICDKNFHPQFPVFVVTANATMEQMFRDFNVVGYMVKPFEMRQLIQDISVIFEKEDQKMKMSRAIGDVSKRRVMVVDHNEKELTKIVKEFKEFGYQIDTADTGIGAMRKIMEKPPHLALISFTLNDIQGDLLILRLQQMAKTRDVLCILYDQLDFNHSPAVYEQIGKKTGVVVLKEYVRPADLLLAVNEVFRQAERAQKEDF